MTDFLPAWSEPFHGTSLGAAPHLDLPGRITREWAYGDGSGRGVKVGVLDSGVEDGHPLVGRVDRAIAVERDINPFLRSRQPAVARAMRARVAAAADDVSIFATLREWKNQFK